MNFIKITLMLVLNLLTYYSYALDVILDEKPVNVPLPVGKEIIITFPQPVTQTDPLGADNIDTLKQFLRPDGVLLLQAGEAFGQARLVATMIDGNVVLLDLNASVGAINHQTINLIDPRTLKKPAGIKVTSHSEEAVEKNPYKPDFLKHGGRMTKTGSKGKGGSSSAEPGFNQMVQYAFRHFVGPSRLIGKQKAKRVAIGQVNAQRLVRVWGKRLKIKALRQWKMGNKYVTVFLVNNTSPNPVEFDPRSLRGRLMFAAALYPVVHPQGSHRDQTLWAIVTNVPVSRALR